MTTLYGISSCDTVRKARNWLNAHGIAFRYHDLRQQGLSADQLARWCACVGLETLLNKRSSSWRQLPPEARATTDPAALQQLMVAQPTLIKRPVLELDDGRIEVGFGDTDYAALFAATAPPLSMNATTE